MTKVFKYKNINLALGYVILLTFFLLRDSSPLSAKAKKKIIRDNSVDEIATDVNRVPIDIRKLDYHNKISNYTTASLRQLDSQENIFQNKSLDLSGKSFKATINNTKEKIIDSNLRIVRIVSLSFFLLLFIPFGLFYPFFIFYKNLLGVEDKEDFVPTTSENDETYFPNYSFNLTNNGLEDNLNIEEEENIQATVSKLQIAFSSQASTLRQQLSQITTSVDMTTDRGVIDLMDRTISVLIAEKYYTHVSHSSISVPFNQVKEEFNLVSCSERSKCMSEELSVINNVHHRQTSTSSRNHDFYSYIIVTLILCTSHNSPYSPLFNKILTKDQLVGELVKLSRMPKDNLLKFELIWNPQEEDEYVNNNKLLIEYSDMNRLF